MAWRRVSHLALRRGPPTAPASGIGATLAVGLGPYGVLVGTRTPPTGSGGRPVQADMNWFAVLAHHAGRAPDRPMTVFEGETTTYGQRAGRAAALAGGLRERGVEPGSVVGLLSYNCPEILETLFAANFLGAIAMPINWRLAPPEVRFILEHS